MNQNFLELCETIQCGLNQKTYTKPLSDEKAFYRLMYENGVAAIIHHALDIKNVSKPFFDSTQKVFYAFIKRDQAQLELKKRLIEIFNTNQIIHIFLKGIELKSLYPETYMRGMGDIDILIESKDLEKVHQVFSDYKIQCTSRSKQHDVFETREGLVIEIHPMLYKDFNTKYEPLFQNPWQYAYPFEQYQYQFEHEFEVIYLLYHLAKHMDSSGIGLRSVLDIGLYVKAYEKDMRIDRLKELLSQVDMTTFYQSVLYLNHVYFQFEYNDSFHLEAPLDDKTIEQAAIYLTTSGIHGLGNDFNSFEARAASYKMKKKSKLHMILDILFPEFEQMKGMYPRLLKIKILLPVAWMLRWFKLIFLKGRSSLRKVRKLKVKDQKVQETEELFIKLGLK